MIHRRISIDLCYGRLIPVIEKAPAVICMYKWRVAMGRGDTWRKSQRLRVVRARSVGRYVRFGKMSATRWRWRWRIKNAVGDGLRVLFLAWRSNDRVATADRSTIRITSVGIVKHRVVRASLSLSLSLLHIVPIEMSDAMSEYSAASVVAAVWHLRREISTQFRSIPDFGTMINERLQSR